MQELDEIKEVEKEKEHPRCETLAAVERFHKQLYGCCHSVVNRQVSGHPRISPLEAELMEMMGDALGG